MEESQNNNTFSSLMQYVILGVLSLVLFHLYNPQAIQESTMSLDCCNWFSRLIQLKLSLVSNSVFLILLSNVIICCLLVSSGLLSPPSEACDLSKECAVEREDLRVQMTAQPCRVEKKYSVHQDERQEVDYIYNESISKGGRKRMFAEKGRACEIYSTENLEEESKWEETVAVVPYQSPLADYDEELKRRFDEFIANFHRQMRLQRGYS